MPIAVSSVHNDQLRRLLRQQRAAVPPRRRQMAARRAWQHLRHWPALRRAKNIACYLAMPGEFPTDEIINGLLRQGKRVYVPVVDAGNVGTMVFQRYRPQSPMKRNLFGIQEPVVNRRQRISPEKLDLVILPLLGFDRCGTRIGMGGGYYDRAFTFRLNDWRMKKPKLLGLAYDVQHCDQLERQPWDVPLDAILTESGLSFPKR